MTFDYVVCVQCDIRDKAYVKEKNTLMCSRNGSAVLVGKVTLMPSVVESMAFWHFYDGNEG